MNTLPPRLSSESGDGVTAEAQAGALLRRMGPPRASRAPRPRQRLRPGVVGALAVLLVGTGVLGGQRMGSRVPRPASVAGPLAAAPAAPTAPLAAREPSPAGELGWPRLRHGGATLAGRQELLLAEGRARVRSSAGSEVTLELTPGGATLELAVRVLQGHAQLVTVVDGGGERIQQLEGSSRFTITLAGVLVKDDAPAAPGPVREARRSPPSRSPSPSPSRSPSTSGPAAAAAVDPLGEESRLLGEAQARLGRGQAQAALERLDELGRRFPAGVLRDEADLLRVASWQRLGRTDQVLVLLERLPLAGQARRLELTVLRGELRARAGRCAGAVADFDRVLGTTGAVPAALAERALHARAACRLRLGQQAAGRADLEAYLQRFPAGPRAAEVRQRLAGPAAARP